MGVGVVSDGFGDVVVGHGVEAGVIVSPLRRRASSLDTRVIRWPRVMGQLCPPLRPTMNQTAARVKGRLVWPRFLQPLCNDPRASFAPYSSRERGNERSAALVCAGVAALGTVRMAATVKVMAGNKRPTGIHALSRLSLVRSAALTLMEGSQHRLNKRFSHHLVARGV